MTDILAEYTARCEVCGEMVLGSTTESLEQWLAQHRERHKGEADDA